MVMYEAAELAILFETYIVYRNTTNAVSTNRYLGLSRKLSKPNILRYIISDVCLSVCTQGTVQT